jgi:hypothetical protein
MRVVMSTSDKIDGFSQVEGVDRDNTLAPGFSQSEGGALVEIVALVARGLRGMRGILMLTI